jgi:hypothetical protein
MNKDIFRENWSSIVIAAQMHRVRRPPDDADTISVTKTVFDDLLLIAQAASQVHTFGLQPAEMTIRHENGEYQITVQNKYLPVFTVSKASLLEAISAAQQRFESERNRLIE